MNEKTKSIFQFILYIIILLVIYWFIQNGNRESFASLEVTDQPDPNTPAPGGVLPWSLQNQRQGRFVVEDNLMPGPKPSYVNFQIVPQPPPWRPPVHPLVVPSMSSGQTGIATYMGLLDIDLPWMSPVFQEFDRRSIERWVNATTDRLQWEEGVNRWNWKPYPDDKKEVQRWHNMLWREASWRPPVQETKDNQAPKEVDIPDNYWKKWAIDWLNRWNGEMVKELNDRIATNRRSRTLDYPFQYGRLWYVQGWDAMVNENKKVRIIQYFGELTRPFGQVIYLMDWIFVGNPNLPNEKPQIDVAWIGSRTYDDVWMPKGLSGDAVQQESTTPADPGPALLPWANIEGELRRKQAQAALMRGNMALAFQCFIPAPATDGKMKSHLLFASSKEDCENRLDFVGREKPKGVWDHPCITDEDCLMYQSNQNYPNQYGRCLENGKCQFPLGMESLGYRYFITGEDSEPYCYNCESNTWLPSTEIGKCCEAQRDKKRFPFLNGPDFAFRGDSPQRERHYRQIKCRANNTGQTINALKKDLDCVDLKRSIPQLYPRVLLEKPKKLDETPGAVEGVSYPSGLDIGMTNVPGQTNATFLNVSAKNANQ